MTPCQLCRQCRHNLLINFLGELHHSAKVALNILIAILLLLAALFFVRREFVQLFEIFSLPLLLVVMGIVLVSGVLICVVSTYFVVNKLVASGKDELYY